MDNETEVIKKYAQSLPQNVKDYMAKDTWSQKLSLIVQISRLSPDQAVALKGEVFLILIGVEKYSGLRDNIKNNIVGVSAENVNNIADYIDKNIFSEIKPILVEMEKTGNETNKTAVVDEDLSKESVLHDIENPTPAKPIITNPAGKNPVLDAQHNLPEGEKKVLISSAAVPSRGPILGNFKTGFATAPVMPAAIHKTPIIPPVQTPKPVPPPQPMQWPPKPAQPPVQPPVQPIIKTLNSQSQQPPPAPVKYKVDPYREPTE